MCKYIGECIYSQTHNKHRTETGRCLYFGQWTNLLKWTARFDSPYPGLYPFLIYHKWWADYRLYIDGHSRTLHEKCFSPQRKTRLLVFIYMFKGIIVQYTITLSWTINFRKAGQCLHIIFSNQIYILQYL